ncbi:MAG: hypothetical protein JNL38_24915 [Myxococcales bacterium]|nr:hypothetical protein [Myxococcales bacterium]
MRRRPAGPRALAALVALAAFGSSSARADAAPAEARPVAEVTQLDEATARADEVSFDARSQKLTLRGNVRVDASPFHLRSEAIEAERTDHGLEIVGDSRVAFCPCLGTPLAIHVAGATVAPPGDLFLDRPTLEVFGLPVLWLPKFWLRSPARVGLLPPTVAYRGNDGVLLGGGLHVPWSSRPEPRRPWPDPETPPDRVLSVRGAGYLKGGARTEATFQTDRSVSRVTWDYLDEHGLALESRGSAALEPARVAWDLDALRGARAVRATSALTVAAAPYDRGAVEVSASGADLTAATAVHLASARGAAGGTAVAGGPDVTLRRSRSRGPIAYDATVDGGTYHLPVPAGDAARALSFARAEIGADASGALGPTVARASARGAAAAASDGQASGVDRAIAVRSELGVPVGRALTGGPDPWLHRVEPSLAAGAIAASESGLFGPGFTRGSPVEGGAGVVDGGIATEIGRHAHRDGLAVEARAGGLLARGGATPALRGRATLGVRLARLSLDGGALTRGQGASGGGAALVARGRLGTEGGFAIGARFSARSGLDPVAARALADPSSEPRVGFVAREGATAGLLLQAPVGGALFSGGLDADVTTRALVAARGGVLLRDGCGCIAVSALVTQRVGREGIDAMLVLDLDARAGRK